MISYIIPTRNRPDHLAATLTAIASLDHLAFLPPGAVEVIVIDNASDPPAELPSRWPHDMPIRLLRTSENLAAASRNLGAQRAQGDWLIMLDDDSYPLSTDFIPILHNAPREIAAIGAEILLPDGTHEAGGLPEVIIGCGAAIRRTAFLSAAGYDPAFHFYAEEYDLCAKLLLAGHRIIHHRAFRVFHEKSTVNRDFNHILQRLVRNNLWVAQRYTPSSLLHSHMHAIIERYTGIAMKESASQGFAAGLAEALATLNAQPRREMSLALHQRFTGEHHFRATLSGIDVSSDTMPFHVVSAGKNCDIILKTLDDLHMPTTCDSAQACALVVGTLSPGPMLDAFDMWSPIARRRNQFLLAPWQMESTQPRESIAR
ncbi:MAG TPA: glycosyltransferase [Phycisphaerales bacterium]|nr:glycosyltransferase [Phycisphaerales bacterium]